MALLPSKNKARALMAGVKKEDPLVLTVVKESGIKEVPADTVLHKVTETGRVCEVPAAVNDLVVVSNGAPDGIVIGDTSPPVDLTDRDRAERAFEEYRKLPTPRSLSFLAQTLGLPHQWVKDWCIQYNWATRARTIQNEERRNRLADAIYTSINDLIAEDKQTGDVRLTLPIENTQDLERVTKIWDKLSGGVEEKGSGGPAVTVIIRND